MIRAILIIGVAALAVGVIIYSLIDCWRSEPRDIRGIRRGPWLAVIILLPVIGGLLWLLLGRPRYLPAGTKPARGRGPDDDPEFLRKLDEQRRRDADRQYDEQVDRWRREHAGDPVADDPEAVDGANGAADAGRADEEGDPDDDQDPERPDGTGAGGPVPR